MNKIKQTIEDNIKDAYLGYGDFRDSYAVELLEESFKRLAVSFSLFLRENYSTQERWENIQLESNTWRCYETDEELTIEQIYNKFLESYGTEV